MNNLFVVVVKRINDEVMFGLFPYESEAKHWASTYVHPITVEWWIEPIIPPSELEDYIG